MRHLMYDCKEVTRMVSESLDRKLPFHQRMGIRVHLFMCKFCSRYRKQLLILREVMRLQEKYIEDTKPWNLAKEGKVEELEAFINLLTRVIRKTANALLPFMPDTAKSIIQQLGNGKIKKGKPLFPRIEIEK